MSFLNKNVFRRRAKMTLRDWRQALNSSPTYRIANSTVRFQAKFVTIITVFGAFLLIILYGNTRLNTRNRSWTGKSSTHCHQIINNTYPLTLPHFSKQGVKFRIGIISDLDTSSKSSMKSHSWISYFQKGYLLWNEPKKQITLNWEEPKSLMSGYGLTGRGMELSELVVYNGKLFTFDDRTGIVYHINGDTVVPWVILTDGDGRHSKGFKSEWASVKDDKLYIGSVGKEWTSATGEFINNNPLWIKIVSSDGTVEHVNWIQNYKKLRNSINIEFPGYIIHESAVWSAVHEKWFFLPRRASNHRYNDIDDEHRSTNVLLIADETFDNIEVRRIGDVVPTRGYSSFKFVPMTNDEVIIALKSEENNGTFATYITGFTIHGEILLPDRKIADKKYEGIEFI